MSRSNCIYLICNINLYRNVSPCTLRRALYFFHRDKLRIRRTKASSISSVLLLFAFSRAWQSSGLPFSAISFANIRISLLLFLNPLAFRRAYFLRTHFGKYQDSLLLFHRLIFSTSALAFSYRTLIHSTQFRSFNNRFLFHFLFSKTENNAKITSSSG